MENKIFYLPKFQEPSDTLPESTEYYGGNLNSSKVSATLSRDALSKWANKVVPAIIPLELINNKNNGNDNKKMNNAN